MLTKDQAVLEAARKEVVESLDDLAQLYEDGETDEAHRFLGESLSRYYVTTGCARMPVWLADKLRDDFDITTAQARKAMDDHYYRSRKSELATVTELHQVSDPDEVEQVVEGEVIEDLSEADARELTEDIRKSADQLWENIIQAYFGRVWLPMGYKNWDEYCGGEFDSAPLHVPRENRMGMVTSLRQQGMSIRAIASATGHDPKTIQSDLKSGVGKAHTPELITGSDGKQQPSTKTKVDPKPVESDTDDEIDDLDAAPESELINNRRNAFYDFVEWAEVGDQYLDDMLAYQPIEQDDEIKMIGDAGDMLVGYVRRLTAALRRTL